MSPAGDLTIRLATPADAAAVHRIYAPVVADSAISFEWDIPSVAELRGRIESTLAAGFPWLIAEAGGEPVGYAYAGTFRARAAYAWAAEASIYIRPQAQRQGAGRKLAGALFRLLERQGFRSVYGVTTAPNPGSEGLLRSLGFELVGRFPRAGYKLGKWHDVTCWCRPIGPAEGAPGPIRPVQEVVRDEPW